MIGRGRDRHKNQSTKRRRQSSRVPGQTRCSNDGREGVVMRVIISRYCVGDASTEERRGEWKI
jgi:ribosomal protein S14